MKNSFSLSSQQMQQKLCLCQQIIQYGIVNPQNLTADETSIPTVFTGWKCKGPVLSEAPDSLHT